MFMAEMAGILDDCEPEKLYICWCDAAIGRVDEAEDTGDLMILRAKGAPGGGGTSFIPVFDWIKEMNIQPAALVYLTDGMGSFPNTEPSYPVIWGNIYPNAKYPFGDVVDPISLVDALTAFKQSAGQRVTAVVGPRPDHLLQDLGRDDAARWYAEPRRQREKKTAGTASSDTSRASTTPRRRASRCASPA